ncbi:hypothetical protein [Salinibaculum rarum]|uniref:hypothetical protein n=1 Tax=Salinibaculum rarum TaxID=3058903 RepID=UPI0026603F14|nr:hypothetical protein [Salinibaculum sp. KK48]
MVSDTGRYPVSDALRVVDGETIYRTDDWWKALVSYQYEDRQDSDSVNRAVYLWHNDDGEWKRKQKYLVRSRDTWITDREYIEEFLSTDSGDPASYDFDESSLPVSDYLTVGDAATVFKTEDWWKAVVRIDGKGDWTTREVVVYVWQASEGEWRRRQKYGIKSQSDWEEEAEIISKYLEEQSTPEESESTFDPDKAKEEIQRKLRRQHLGETLE